MRRVAVVAGIRHLRSGARLVMAMRGTVIRIVRVRRGTLVRGHRVVMAERHAQASRQRGHTLDGYHQRYDNSKQADELHKHGSIVLRRIRSAGNSSVPRVSFPGMIPASCGGPPSWPALPYAAWGKTCATLHLWLQIVGKIPLAQLPWISHSWHVAFALTARGLATSLMPHGTKAFQVEFDFIEHRLRVQVSDGRHATLPLGPQTVAAFYRSFMETLQALEVPVSIRTMPSELPNPIPFDQDETHGSYDPEYANRYWRVLLQTQRVFDKFRSGYLGKCSPVHFFWGSADLAVTRFSGRPAPPHPGGVPHLPDWVVRDAYSHEVSSAGFWAGNEQQPYPIFYSYAYPEPAGYAQAPVRPSAARYSTELREFILPYEAVATSASPDETLLEFLESTYQAAARRGGWPPVVTPSA
jgi:hypothetical protein